MESWTSVKKCFKERATSWVKLQWEGKSKGKGEVTIGLSILVAISNFTASKDGRVKVTG